MINLKNLSVRRKLINIQLITTFIVLFFYTIFHTIYDLRESRKALINQLTTVADLIGANSASAITFLDNNAAEALLASLDAEGLIVNGWIYDKNGAIFAKYAKKGYEKFNYPQHRQENCICGSGFIIIMRTINHDDEQIGMIALRMHTQRFKELAMKVLGLPSSVLIIGMLVAFLLSTRTQKTISAPILSLAEVVQNVSQTGNYLIRVVKKGNDEIGVLYDGFNSLMEQITIREKERDRAETELKKHRDQLELLVQERTKELTDTVKLLQNEITEREQAVEALKESEEIFRTVVTNSEAVIFIVNQDGRFILSEGKGLEKLELKPGQVVGASAIEMYAGYPEIINGIKSALNGVPYTLSAVEVQKRVFECFYSPYRNSESEVIGCIGMAADITERRRAEEEIRRHQDHLEELVEERTEKLQDTVERLEAEVRERKRIEESLRESESRFKTLVSNIPGVTYRYAFDTDWTAEFISDGILNLTGYPSSDYIHNNKRTFASMIHPDDSKMVADTIADAVRKKQIYALEYRVNHADGTVRWVHERGQAIFGSDDKTLWLDGAILDITEQKRNEEIMALQEQQLMQADKMATLGILVSGVAHEINNPNNFMLLNSNNLSDIWRDLKPLLDKWLETEGEFIIAGMRYSDMCDEVAALIDGISEGSERIRRIVQSLKDFARQDSGGMDQPVHVNRLIESSAIILGNLIRKTTDHFKLDFDNDLPVIRGNAQQIEQVVLNLVTNACQSLHDKSRAVTISTGYIVEKNTVLIKVTDEGDGISEDNLKHIMDPFFTTKRDTGGTGLGLSISYNIIKSHNGDLSISSKTGSGTTAVISLPV